MICGASMAPTGHGSPAAACGSRPASTAPRVYPVPITFQVHENGRSPGPTRRANSGCSVGSVSVQMWGPGPLMTCGASTAPNGPGFQEATRISKQASTARAVCHSLAMRLDAEPMRPAGPTPRAISGCSGEAAAGDFRMMCGASTAATGPGCQGVPTSTTSAIPALRGALPPSICRKLGQVLWGAAIRMARRGSSVGQVVVPTRTICGATSPDNC